MNEYDLVVIGAGPGGYVAAIRGAQLGMKTALIEKYSTLGGTCLNVGCIPSKALLDSSEHFYNTKHHAADFGFKATNVTASLKAMVERKNAVVEQTTSGIAGLMVKNKVDTYQGLGSFVDANTIKIAGEKEETIKGKNIIIATGSKPASIPNVEIDKKRVITSTEMLNLTTLPKNLIVIGGGVIGLELGSVMLRLGSKVSVVEYAPSIIPTMDKDLGKSLQRTLKKQGMEFNLSHAVQSVSVKGREVTVAAKNKKGEDVEFKGDYVLVSTGRRPYTDGLGLENAGVKVNERGQIETGANLQTTAPNIYAIGDVVKGAMLAHKAEEEGVAVVEHLAGLPFHVNYNTIPGVVYTWPEVASVGKTEQELKDAGVKYKSGNFNYKASGRARAAGETDGFVKVLADEATDEVLGVHMYGARVADMIGEAVVAMEYRASAEDIGRICHAHPTFSECLKEAALGATDNRMIHS